MDSIKKVINVLCILILSVGFLGTGMLCLVGYPQLITAFENWGYPKAFMYVIGVLELAIAIMVFHKPWRFYGFILGVIIMIGAITTHIKSKEYDQLYGPVAVLILLIIFYLSETKQEKTNG